eukprot:1362225-Amorphochlora_amoeboformis.AAC.2
MKRINPNRCLVLGEEPSTISNPIFQIAAELIARVEKKNALSCGGNPAIEKQTFRRRALGFEASRPQECPKIDI